MEGYVYSKYTLIDFAGNKLTKIDESMKEELYKNKDYKISLSYKNENNIDFIVRCWTIKCITKNCYDVNEMGLITEMYPFKEFIIRKTADNNVKPVHDTGIPEPKPQQPNDRIQILIPQNLDDSFKNSLTKAVDDFNYANMPVNYNTSIDINKEIFIYVIADPSKFEKDKTASIKDRFLNLYYNGKHRNPDTEKIIFAFLRYDNAMKNKNIKTLLNSEGNISKDAVFTVLVTKYNLLPDNKTSLQSEYEFHE